MSQLPDTVNELNENRWPVCIGVIFISMTDTLKENYKETQTLNWRIASWATYCNLSFWQINYRLETMTKAQPFFFKQHLKSTNRPVITIKHEHGQRCELGCSVPTIAAVNHYWSFARLHFVSNSQCSGQNQLQDTWEKWNNTWVSLITMFKLVVVLIKSWIISVLPWCVQASVWTQG